MVGGGGGFDHSRVPVRNRTGIDECPFLRRQLLPHLGIHRCHAVPRRGAGDHPRDGGSIRRVAVESRELAAHHGLFGRTNLGRWHDIDGVPRPVDPDREQRRGRVHRRRSHTRRHLHVHRTSLHRYSRLDSVVVASQHFECSILGATLVIPGRRIRCLLHGHVDQRSLSDRHANG